MIRKYHNHKLKTNPWHREEEPHNHHETPGRQTKQSNQLSLQIQIVLTFQAFVRPFVYSQIDHLFASFFILHGKHMAKYDIHIMELLPGFLGNRQNDIYSRGTGKKRSNFEWNRVQRQYWGTWNVRKQFSILGEQGNKPIYFRGTRERLSP